MRFKKANIRMKYFGPRVMSALQVWLWLLIFIFQNEFRISYGTEPGYLDFDNLPETNFSCVGKVIGGYYADLETDCQMFHVCTIGQNEEPMDIKFLCLNGTVFDQETRVCERVDEVDCSLSTKFYKLNLELYGNTAPPIIKEEPINHEEDDEDEEYSDLYEDPSTTTIKTTKLTTTTTTTTTQRPTTTSPRSYTTAKPTYYQTTIHEYQDSEIEDEDELYDTIEESQKSPTNQTSEHPNEPYHHYNVDSQLQRPSGNKNQFEDEGSKQNGQIFSPQEFIYHHNKQNFQQKSPAISFQQHTYTNNGQNSHVTVTTHTGKTNYNNQNVRVQNTPVNKLYLPNNPNTKPSGYNSYTSFTPPKRIPLVPPTSQIQAPTGHPGLSTPKHPKQPNSYYAFRKPQLTPQGFKPSQPNQPIHAKNPPKVNQNYQSSERHEISVEREYEFEKITPNFQNQDYSNRFEKKGKADDQFESSSYEAKESDTKTTTGVPYYNSWISRGNNYTKSLPSVIITASASVSDSNGKKLNYSVGNIVHAVKPLIATNYDDYKESDVALDPFFLDVPKLKKGRSKRNQRHYIVKVYNRDSSKSDAITPVSNVSTRLEDPLTSASAITKPSISQETAATKSTPIAEDSTPWIPPDYVDDNYEPVVYREEKSTDKQPIGEISTDNYARGKTSDLVKALDLVLNNNGQKPSQKYRLASVRIVNLPEDINDNKYTCREKKYYKFYPDKSNCRTFHMCAPSVKASKIMDVVFICDLGTYFNNDNCTTSKPNNCEIES